MKGSKSKVHGTTTWEIIDAYTRKQAIEDGVLVDVSKMAREAGIRYPVALTWAVWCGYVLVPEGVTCQDEDGRLWDIIWMTRCSLEASPGVSPVGVWLYVRNDNQAASLVMLKATLAPGDEGEPVVTVMMRCED